MVLVFKLFVMFMMLAVLKCDGDIGYLGEMFGFDEAIGGTQWKEIPKEKATAKTIKSDFKKRLPKFYPLLNEAKMLKNLDKHNKDVSEEVIEKWVSKNFRKPHKTGQRGKLFSRTKVDTKHKEGKNESQNNKLRSLGSKVGNLLDKQKIDDYLVAERKWEREMIDETQTLLNNLKPDDAYVIPELPLLEQALEESGLLNDAVSLEQPVPSAKIISQNLLTNDYTKMTAEDLSKRVHKFTAKKKAKLLKQIAKRKAEWVKMTKALKRKMKSIESRLLKKDHR